MTTVPLQVAFQGGGARIAALIAVVEALQALEESKSIRVTRVAGTSAGALAAALLSSGFPASEIKKLASEHAPRVEKAFRTRLPGAIFRAIVGRPVWDLREIEAWLKVPFAGMTTIGDLSRARDIPLSIVSTDLRLGSARACSESDDLITSLLDSCGLPFLIRPRGSERVDGGFCENLPSSYLFDERKKYGPVLGVTFADTGALPAVPRGLVRFGARVVEAGIQHNVVRARKELGEDYLHAVRTSLSTLSFKAAITAGLGAEYELVRDRATAYVDTVVKRERERAGHNKIDGDPWRFGDAARMADQFRIYDGLKEDWTAVTHKSVRMELTANSLAGAQETGSVQPDFLRYVFHIEVPPDRYVFARMLGFNSAIPALVETNPHVRLDARHWKARRLRDDSEIHVIAVPCLNPDEPHRREMILYFQPPLSAKDGTVLLEFQDVANSLLGQLSEKGHDHIGFQVRETLGLAGEVQIFLRVPKGARQVIGEPVNGRCATAAELSSAETAAFDTQGWVFTSDSDPDLDFCVDLRYT